MFRRSSGGGDGVAKDKGQRFGPVTLFKRGDVSTPRLEKRETGYTPLVATFLVTY